MMRTESRSLLLMAVFAAVLMLGMAGWAAAGVVWDGAGDPVAAGLEYTSVIPGEPDGSPPDPFTFDYCNGQSWTGILYQDTTSWSAPGESAASYGLPAATAATEMVRANGWTVETRVRVNSNTGDLFGAVLTAGDDVGGMGLLLRSNEIHVYESSWASYPTPNATIPVTFDYHDIRIQVAAGGFNADIYVDDMGTPAATIALSNEPNARVSFGDASSGSAGVAYWDHLAVNATAPAPTTPPQVGGLNLDVTFETGALPTDLGMVAGGVDPVSNVSGGAWTNTRLAGETSSWKSADLPGTISGPIIHGFAEIEQADFGGSHDDQTIIALGTDMAGSVSFLVYFGNGGMAGLGGSSLNSFEAVVPNQDSAKHAYGWELDMNTNTVKLFFDDVQVGEEDGYNVAGNFFGEELMYFGDASGGNDHSEVWDRWVIAEGAYPAEEPPVDIPGDANGDGKVDDADATILATNWQKQTGATWAEGDFNDDGAVTDADATILATNWQTGVAAAASVPEPGTIALLAGVLLGIVLIRRKNR